MDEDAELRLINARKLAELRRRAEQAAFASVPKPEKTNKEIVLEALYDRGDEVLETAYQTFPRETGIIVDQMAKLMKQTGRRERISGGELYSLFRSIGLRFKLDTTIKVQESGRLVDLKDKLKMKADEG